MKATRLLRLGGTVAGAGVLSVGACTALAWARYGHVDPARHPPDALLDRFLPNPEVDEYHQLKVRAPAAITLAAAKELDLQTSPVVKGIFWLRAIPTLLRGEPFRPQGSRGLVEDTLAQGWGVLAEEPDRAIVVGAYTQPWHEQVTFHPLLPDQFARFNEPGYVKIAWTLQAEPLGPNASLLITRTRAVATDPQSRKRFRRYWAPMSAGIILIRYAGLPLMRKEAERRAAVGEAQLGSGNGRPGVIIEHAVDIERSSEEVFDYCTDLGREPEWSPRTRRIDKLAAGPIRVGTRYEGEWVKDDPMTIEFVRLQRPTSWATVGRSKRLVATSEGQVSTTPDGVRLVLRTRLQPRGALRLLRPVLGLIMRQRENRNLQAIKAALEQERGPSPPASDPLQ
jgi:polyketide cyclase/dehydrase/lipid transport protein